MIFPSKDQKDKYSRNAHTSILGNGLHSYAVRELGKFLKSRRARVGFSSTETFAKHVGKARQTVYGLFDTRSEAETATKHIATLDAVAIGLKFRDWDDLLRSWRADDVNAGLQEGDPAAATRRKLQLDDLPEKLQRSVLIKAWAMLPAEMQQALLQTADS